MSRVLDVRAAGDDHQVVTVKGGGDRYRREPCQQCPWRTDQDGSFPPEAFCHSANTAYDMSTHEFACHMSGVEKSATCAGFILHGSDHNMAARLRRRRGLYGDVTDGGHDLHESYRSMAVANGVEEDNPHLLRCRD